MAKPIKTLKLLCDHYDQVFNNNNNNNNNNNYYYYYLKDRNRRAKAAISRGMREWSRKTCIRFKKRTNEAAFAYFKPGSG